MTAAEADHVVQALRSVSIIQGMNRSDAISVFEGSAKALRLQEKQPIGLKAEVSENAR